MVDNEIKKALECCILGDCQGCFYGDTYQRHCKDDLMQNALDIINRLQAENKDKEALLNHQGETIKTLENVIKNTFLEKAGLDIDPLAEIKAEAYKEFAERLKECAFTVNQFEEVLYKEDIDDLLKEMVGEDNG